MSVLVLKIAQGLQEAGISKEIAYSIATAIDQLSTENAARKSDVDAVESSLKLEISSAENRLRNEIKDLRVDFHKDLRNQTLSLIGVIFTMTGIMLTVMIKLSGH